MENRFAVLTKEFPDFDVATLPAVPAHWADTSWHNDTCPCFKVCSDITDTGGEGVYCYIDFADSQKDLREFPDADTRFSLIRVFQDGTTETILDGNDWQAVLVAAADEELTIRCEDYSSGKPDESDVQGYADAIAKLYGVTVSLDADQVATWGFAPITAEA